MQSRLQEILSVLKTPFQPCHLELLEEARILITHPSSLPQVLGGLFSSPEMFCLICKFLTQAFNFQLSLEEDRRLQHVLGRRGGVSTLVNKFQQKDFLLIVQTLYDYSLKHASNNLIDSHIADLTSVCLQLILHGKNDCQHIHSLQKLYFPSYPQPAANTLERHEKRLMKLGLTIIKTLLDNQATDILDFQTRKQRVETFEDYFLKPITCIGVTYFEYFMILKAQNSIQPEDEMLIYKIIELLESVLSFPMGARMTFDEAPLTSRDCHSFPAYLEVFWSHPTLFPSLYTLSLPLISLPSCPAPLLPIVHKIFKIINIIPTINPPYAGEDKSQFQTKMFHIIKSICVDLQLFESQLLSTILKMFYTYLAKKKKHCETKKALASEVMQFCLNAMAKFKIVPLWDGELNWIFRTVRVIEHLYYETSFSMSIRSLLIFMQRLTQNESALAMQESGFDPIEEIQIMKEWLKGVKLIAPHGMTELLQFMGRVQLQSLPDCCVKVWMFTIYPILLNRSSEAVHLRQQALLIKSYLMMARFHRIQFLFFVRQMLGELLQNTEHGIPSSSLWEHLAEVINIPFSEFLSQILKGLFQVFLQPCLDIISYVLELLLEIYTFLNTQKQENCNFRLYCDIYKGFLLEIQKSVFGQREYFRKRKQLMKIAVYTHLDTGDPKRYLTFYNQIVCASVLNNPSLHNFEKMMYDVSGIISGLGRKEDFESLMDYLIDDLDFFNQQFIIGKDLSTMDPEVLRTMLHLLSSIVGTHFIDSSLLRMRIYHLACPLMPHFLKPNFSKKVYNVYSSYILYDQISPIEYLPPPPEECKDYQLKPTLNAQLEKKYSGLIETCFGSIRRVKDISRLFDSIKYNVEYMYMWWMEANRRQHPAPSPKVHEMLNKRAWRNQLELEMLGIILHRTGIYRQTQQLGALTTLQLREDDFVDQFMQLCRR